ncbi:unnamed protein product [Ectocarpus sp. CCAP 1310/34]|nr:unnamed protein product [Ectocarpus sp. CCAP 1310/34]
MNTPTSALSPGSSVGASRRQSVGSEGKGEAEAHGMDHWALVGEKLTAEKHLAEDAKKVLVSDIKSSLRRLMDDISEDNWMYDPIDLGQGHQHGR